MIFFIYFLSMSFEKWIDSMFLSPSLSYFSFGIICGRLWGSLAVSGSFAFGYESSGGSSDFRLPTSVAIKSGRRPTRLLPYSKMLLVPVTFFFFCRVDYALEGSTFFMSKCDLSRLFHTERPGGVRTTIAKHHGRYSKSDHLCQDGVE